MTSSDHDRWHATLADVLRYAEAEARGELPPPVIGVEAAVWITRSGPTYAALVERARIDCPLRPLASGATMAT